MIRMFAVFCAILCITSFASATTTASDQIQPTNLLFIMFDDLRLELSVYGRKHMITPNFERLASKSVVFDNAYTGVSVCNPSRDSLLTGLRPDTVGTYAFQSSWPPHYTLPAHLVSSGYQTAGIGKIFHWEGNDPKIWSHTAFENGWYDYQGKETSWMNSSTMPDKTRKEEEFRDHIFAEKAVTVLKDLVKSPKYFMLAVGFKLPHLALHVPYDYYKMYKGKEASWALSQRELVFPQSSPSVSYRCCAENDFRFMEEEGGKQTQKTKHITPPNNINEGFTNEMHNELMLGYCAAVTFVDKQLGKLLDAVDELKLWHNLTIILTADHGMHNGEKGLWEKWTLFDESTRVPLFISHPKSPHQGMHYEHPVESIDIYRTIKDLLILPFDSQANCPQGSVCHPLQGKSLAPVVLGEKQYAAFQSKHGASGGANGKHQRRQLSQHQNEKYFLLKDLPSNYSHHSDVSKLRHMKRRDHIGHHPNSTVNVKLERNFAISQLIRCANKEQVRLEKELLLNNPNAPRSHFWHDCDRDRNPPEELPLIGYSMRTLEFRYTAWFHYNRARCIPILDVPPFEEELYDHRRETLSDYTHLEVKNIALVPALETIRRNIREDVILFIKKQVVFRGCF